MQNGIHYSSPITAQEISGQIDDDEKYKDKIVS